MFRLVPYADATPGADDLANYASGIVSDSILREMDRVFKFHTNADGSEEVDREAFQSWFDEYYDSDFFKGIGSYLGAGSDYEAGGEIILRKIYRMREKLRDPEKFITFDILEERILADLLDGLSYFVAGYEVSHSTEDVKKFKKRFFRQKEYKESIHVLRTKYGLKKKEAKKLAKDMYRLYRLDLYSHDGEDNLIFWDTDYDTFFSDGFIQGLMGCKGTFGEMRGYGYAYTCEIFSDIGITPPLRLLGSEEANRLINEKTKNQYMEQMNSLFDYIVHAGREPSEKDQELLERFPFLKDLRRKLEDEEDGDEDGEENE